MDKKEKIKKEIEATAENIKYFESRVKDNEDLKSKLETELAELEQEDQEWKPQDDEEYWYVNLDMMITVQCAWYNREIDNIRLQHKVIFKTKDEAEEYLEYLQAKEKAMNEFSKEEWEDGNILKYYIYYNYVENRFGSDFVYQWMSINEMYFRTIESAEEFINKYEKFMKRELGI